MLISSCEENFSPKSDFNEKIILYSIINADSTRQTALLERSYNVPGFDPYVNTIDPFISDAEIRLRQGDNVIFMKDTIIDRTDTSRYNNPLSYFYTDNFNISGNDPLEIIATLADGRQLYAITNLPLPVLFDTSNDNILPPDSGDTFRFSWQSQEDNIWFLPKFEFFYRKDGVRYSKEVPIGFIEDDQQVEPIYPDISQSSALRFEIEMLDSAFLQISRGDPDKSSYEILGSVFTVLIFDQNLSDYISSTNGFLDDFTVILDENDFTNIQGGFGIFGSYIIQKTGALFTEDYIKSFGYTPGL